MYVRTTTYVLHGRDVFKTTSFDPRSFVHTTYNRIDPAKPRVYRVSVNSKYFIKKTTTTTNVSAFLLVFSVRYENPV